MRRALLSARSSRLVSHAFAGRQSRRAFAAPASKDDSPPSPILPSSDQAHPIGPFYEAIMRSPKLPSEKPEAPPVTSQDAPVQEPKPTPEHKQSKPVSEEPAEKADDKKPARRARKPRHTAAMKSEAKAKSVPPSSLPSASPTSSHPPPAQEQDPKKETSPSSAEPQEIPQEQEPPSNDVQARARVVFGSGLAGPAERAERLERLRTQSRMVAGVLVPPRPEEPDNCCMSGCVNCVWDRYRDEMEEWAGKTAEAERRLRAQEAGDAVGVTEDSMEGVERGRRMQLGVHDEVGDRGAASMEDDGGGSAAVGGWDPGAAGESEDDFWDEELYKNVPVGIREFMKHEKRLRERRLREGVEDG